MWMNYTLRYIRNNTVSSVVIASIAFIASTLLSFINGIFYNLIIDYINRTVLLTGSPPKGPQPLLAAYLFVLAAVVLSLIVMIHNAFEVTMSARLHQTGILQSVGASPEQLTAVLLLEAAFLCLLPVTLGVMAGGILCYVLLNLALHLTAMVRRYEVAFQYHIAVALASFLSAILTVGISAWVPARKISRLTPLEAIHWGEEPPVEKMKRFRLISRIAGVEGELARKSFYARRRSFKTSSISLTLAFLAFTSFLNVEAVSAASTQITYFEKYKDVWDFFITVDREDAAEGLPDEIRAIPGVASCTKYRRYTGWTVVTDSMASQEVNAAGGLEKFGYLESSPRPDSHIAEVPLIVLDRESYDLYKAGNHGEEWSGNPLAPDSSMEVILVNTLWDNLHSRRTDKTFLPYLAETPDLTLEIYPDPASVLTSQPENSLSASVHAFTGQAPKIREEYPAGSLTAVTSEESYRKAGGDFPEGKIYLNITAEPDGDLSAVYERLQTLLSGYDSALLESRELAEKADAPIRRALKYFISALAFLLALIGLTNVFSGTLGQIYQRKKEFARYFSAGLSPEGMKKILLMETLFISLRPIATGLLLNVFVVLAALYTADLPVSKFISYMPALPVFSFALFIILAVHLACWLGGRKILNETMIDTLKDDAMV